MLLIGLEEDRAIRHANRKSYDLSPFANRSDREISTKIEIVRFDLV